MRRLRSWQKKADVNQAKKKKKSKRRIRQEIAKSSASQSLVEWCKEV